MKTLAALWLLTGQSAFAGYGGYILFQTVPSKAGASSTAPYSLLISGTYPSFATTSNGGKVVNTVACGVNSIVCPADLIFTQDSQCTAPYSGWDVISYSPVSGQLTLSVAIPMLSNTAPVKIYGCVGNSQVTTFQGGARGAAYDSNYLLALHMEETSGTVLHDSTANANDAAKKGAAQPQPIASGVIGGAQAFAGAANSINNDYATFGQMTAPTDTWTIEYWTNAQAYLNTDVVFLENSSGIPTVATGFYWYPQGTVSFRNTYNGDSPAAPGTASAGIFHYVSFVRNGDSMNVYLDGMPGTAVSGWGTGTEQWKGLGWDGGANAGFNSFYGAMDEVFYSNTARSADYITARYNNLSSPSTFCTVSPYMTVMTVAPSTTRADSQVIIFF